MFEVGCGVGNTIYPLREEFPNLFFYGCDLSPRAVDLVKVSSWRVPLRLFILKSVNSAFLFVFKSL